MLWFGNNFFSWMRLVNASSCFQRGVNYYKKAWLCKPQWTWFKSSHQRELSKSLTWPYDTFSYVVFIPPIYILSFEILLIGLILYHFSLLPSLSFIKLDLLGFICFLVFIHVLLFHHNLLLTFFCMCFHCFLVLKQ
jgi:hypothetical protein